MRAHLVKFSHLYSIVFQLITPVEFTVHISHWLISITNNNRVTAVVKLISVSS